MISTRSATWLDIAGVLEAVQQASVKPLDEAALLVETDAKESMTQGGVVQNAKADPYAYYDSVHRRWVTASAPKTPPHRQSGTLAASIKTARTSEHTAVVGPTSPPAWYGVVHEFGGVHHAKRPFMRPALMRKRREFPKLFKALRLAATRAGRRLNRSKRPR